MYSPKLNDQQIAKAASLLGRPLRRSAPREISVYREHFDSLVEKQKGGGYEQLRALTPAEQQWIENERTICTIDFNYWARNYARIKDRANKPSCFLPQIGQSIILDIWSEMEEQGIAIMVQILKARQLGMCLTPLTKILTADLHWIPIDDVEIGQEVIAVDESSTSRQIPRKLRTAIVEAKREVFERAYKITMANGAMLIATAPHRFLCRHRTNTITQWRKVSDMRAGDVIRHVVSPWEAGLEYEDGWFSGILDGEGCLRAKTRAGVEACMSQVQGKVLDRAAEYLSSRGYSYRVEIDNRKGGESSKFGNKPVVKLVLSTLQQVFKLVGQTQPSRFPEGWWVGKELPGKGGRSKLLVKPWIEIVSIEELEPQRMIDLQTSTKTFLAEGFVSHNSTLTELAVAHRVQFHSHVNAIVASSDPDKSRKMAEMMLFNWDHQPWWLMPARTKYKAGELIEFGDLGSAVSIQWGNQTTGIARGTTPTIAHLSELADFENPAELVDASLMRAMHDDPFVLLVLESTASGRDNWWHRKWEYAKANYTRGLSRLRPIFLPWYVGTDLYPNATWLKGHPIPTDYIPAETVENHALRARDYVRANPTLREVLGAGEEWALPLEQKWFYEANRHQYASEGILNKWYQEMPADDLEAFQHRQMSVFNAEFLEEKRNACNPPLCVFGLRGPEDEIPLRLQPTDREIDFNSPFKPLPIYPNKLGCRTNSVYTLVPLKFTGTSDTDPLGKIFLYSLPERNNEYGLGVDTAYGVGKDRTVIQVIRKASPYANAEQCAEFATDIAGAFEIWPFTLALATLYSTISHAGGTESRQARIAIEQAANGEATYRELAKRGWRHFHTQLKSGVRGAIPTNQTTPIQMWKTTESSRGPMLDFLMKALKDSWLDINSPWFVDEMGNFIRNEKKERLEAAEGAKDDRLMACGIILDSLHNKEQYRSATPSWQARLAAEAAEKVYPTYKLGWNVATSDSFNIDPLQYADSYLEDFS